MQQENKERQADKKRAYNTMCTDNNMTWVRSSLYWLLNQTGVPACLFVQFNHSDGLVISCFSGIVVGVRLKSREICRLNKDFEANDDHWMQPQKKWGKPIDFSTLVTTSMNRASKTFFSHTHTFAMLWYECCACKANPSNPIDRQNESIWHAARYSSTICRTFCADVFWLIYALY